VIDVNVKWWGISLDCPEHKKSCILQVATFSADGELRFTFWCPDCKEFYNYQVFASALQHRALMNDIGADKQIPRKPQPVRPPTALPSPPTVLTDDDKEWEHFMGIDPEDGRLE
jgi:hypothetical protein